MGNALRPHEVAEPPAETLRRFVADSIGEDGQRWPRAWSPTTAGRLLEQARADGVAALLRHTACRGRHWDGWPETLRLALTAEARQGVAVELARQHELARVLERLHAGAVPVLLLKGVALAHQYYPEPGLRARGDTDLLIRGRDRDRAEAVLENCGYAAELQVPGQLVSAQFAMSRTDSAGLTHRLDVHCKLSNAHAFADLLSFEEMADDAGAIPSLGPHARAPSAAHALLHACVHRCAHHQDSDRLIWLYDIHLLCESLGPIQAVRFWELVLAKQAEDVCRSGIRLARCYFRTRLTEEFAAALAPGGETDDADPRAAAGTPPRPTRGRQFVSELAAVGDMRAKLQFLRETLIPPPGYMLRRYRPRHRAALPYLYARRIARGVRQLLRDA